MPADYTPGQVTKMFGIPASTLRRYVAVFGDHLSDNARRLRNRTFTEADIEVIINIRDMASRGISLEKITPQLAGAVKDVKRAPDESPPSAMVLVSRVADQVDSISTQLERQAAAMASMQARLDALEAERNLPWYKRIFGK